VGLRLIFFGIGLFSVLVYFEVAKRILKNTLIAFTAALLYIASPAVFSYFYFLHPESTGLLFSFLGVYCLLRFTETRGDDYRWYTLGLVFLVLSALSKHVFFITALPVLFLFYYTYCHYHNISIFRFAFSRQFIKVLLLSALLALLIFFIINPYAFIQFREFVVNQRFMFSTQTNGAVSRVEAIRIWLGTVKIIPVMYLSIVLAPVTILGAVILERDNKIGRTFFIVSLVSSIVYVILISISARYLIQIGYFAPIYPYFVLNFLILPLYLIRKWNIKLVNFVAIASLIYFLFFVLVSDFSDSIPKGYTRLMYKESPMYQVYTYIKDNIPPGSKIAHDHLVVIPSVNGLISCHYWSDGCGTNYIEKFKPDYVIFSESWKFNGETVPATQRLEKYVTDHHFIHVDTLTLNDKVQISVWKKPEH
jgi:dolichyl-phosphate-mannose-protein mannosyltransferase